MTDNDNKLVARDIKAPRIKAEDKARLRQQRLDNTARIGAVRSEDERIAEEVARAKGWTDEQLLALTPELIEGLPMHVWAAICGRLLVLRVKQQNGEGA